MICPGCRGEQRGRKRQLNILLHVLGRQVREKAHFLENTKKKKPFGPMELGYLGLIL